MQYTETLKQAGLSEAQALVFQALLKEKEARAGKLAKILPLKRGLIYKSLDDLVALGLAEKEEDPGKVALYRAKHPAALRGIIDTKEREVRDAKSALDGLLPSLASDFNLYSSIPGVLVYEGEAGVEEVLNDSLRAKEVIYSYVDVEAVEKNIGEINARYMKKRERLDIYKKLLVPDTPFIRDLYSKEKSLVTEVRAIPESVTPFQVTMQIYDGKVSYLTLADDRKLGVIIEDPHIYQMHKYLFEMLYEKAEVLAR
jgi:sugar-specific transcriptional regulator TrmB